MRIRRRSVLLGAASSLAGLTSLSACRPARADFETLFARAQADLASLEAARSLRERPALLQGSPPGPRTLRSDRRIAPQAVRLIVLCEVTSEQFYKARYTRPVWPGGQSGATIGVGYDLGYIHRSWLQEDWSSYLPQHAIQRLQITCGKHGASAEELVPGLRDITVPWNAAYSQFNKRALPLYVGETLEALPLADDLSDKSLGALVSLVYNRGPGFSVPPDPYSRAHHVKDRYFEMRAIKTALEEKAYDRIPGLIEQMARLWPQAKYAGIVARRKMEARLFEEGLVDT